MSRMKGKKTHTYTHDDGGCPKAAKPKHSHFKGGIDVSSAIPHYIRLSAWSSSPCWRTADSEVCDHLDLQKVQSLMRHNFMHKSVLLTVYILLYGRPGSSEVPRNPLTRWDVSAIPANGIFLTEKLKN